MFTYPRRYDVIVIGAGHAGIEAALAAARMGSGTLLLTTNLDTIGQMSCNPAIGGLAKGHLVREIDALGGEMGRCADLTGLHFRMLNTSKGPAVRAPRAQCDKRAYQVRMKWACERQARLDVRQAQVTTLIHHAGCVTGVETNIGVRFDGQTFIVTTGTFLHGLMHIGASKHAGGRLGDSVSAGISESLQALGLNIRRFKTGTPPRLNKRTIDFSRLEVQPGDFRIHPFSHWNSELFHVEQAMSDRRETQAVLPGSVLERAGRQLDCHITYTTAKTARIIRDNLDKSPLYTGIIQSTGPRYCPSIEDKVVRFKDKESHQIFLEPEGLETDEIYVNGLSTSLPYEVQLSLVQSIVGCESAEIVRPAYAVEYDYADSLQLDATLRVKTTDNLYLAGQINGTSGYEEAAAQGLVAGINAARTAVGQTGITFTRDRSYIGVLIDDLVTVGTPEPYRMFTSRAEHRLLLRQDNADLRLSSIGREVGLLSAARAQRVEAKRKQIDDELHRLSSTRVDGRRLLQVLRRPEVSYSDLPAARTDLPPDVVDQVEITAKYAGYLGRQHAEVAKHKRLESLLIPDAFDFSGVSGLRTEARHKLASVRPRTLGQAGRISGVTPADLGLLAVWVERHRKANG